jgi:hypothetical protein
LQGGLDLQTPAISIAEGRCIDAQNYEPNIDGGYRRIDGHERTDGRALSSAQTYWIVAATITGTVTNGATLTGNSSGATGIVLGVFYGTNIVLGRVSGTFLNGEALKISGAVVATATANSLAGSASSVSDDADYTLLAANDWRALIQPLPGSGPVRGVWIYKDTLYAFRDNVGGTAGLMYQATPTGWQQVQFGYEIQFTAGASTIAIGNTVTGGTSGATGTVAAVLVRTGAFGSAGVGSLVFSGITGTFQNGEPLKVGATTCATAASTCAQITRLPGGQMEFTNGNFTGSTSTQKMYGVDGVNCAFEFDGTTYVPIHTGMPTDTPNHIAFHKSYLFMSFLGSVQFSGIGNPYAWTTILGSGEVTTGDPVTGFLAQGGNAQGSALAIFTKGKTFILYGNTFGTGGDAHMVPSVYDLGYLPFTFQPVSNNTFGMTARGIQSLITTLTYGDFDYSSISHDIQPLIAAKQGMACASYSSRSRDMYCVYFTDGTGLAVGLNGDNVNGLMPLNYGKVVRCICASTLSNGTEVAYFGSDDGYVYLLNSGTSFDGQPIEAWVRLPFNAMGSPRLRKRYRRAVLEVSVTAFCQVNVSWDLGYGTVNAAPQSQQPNSSMVGYGGYWDQFTWDTFVWDTQVISDPTITLAGTEKNIGFLFYSNRAQDKSHILQGITVTYSEGRLER